MYSTIQCHRIDEDARGYIDQLSSKDITSSRTPEVAVPLVLGEEESGLVGGLALLVVFVCCYCVPIAAVSLSTLVYPVVYI